MNRYIFPFLWMRGEEEEILRREIQKICECGIRAVCVEARPHDDFCGPGWWHDMDIVLDEAKKRDMKIWILDDKHFPTGYANGLIEKKYPERKKQYIACTTADVFGASRPLTLNVTRMLKPTIGFWEIGNPVDYEEQANNTLVSLVALRFREGSLFSEDAIDLTDRCQNGMASFQLPEGQWRVHAIYRTRADGGNDTYINMIDAQSAHTQIEGVYEAHFQHYGEEFGKTIAGFFSDEPQFGNISDQCFDTKLGKKKMPLPWSGELEELLKERWGNNYATSLPFLFAGSFEKKREPQIRYDYMDSISKLYAKNFSRPVGEWCHDHGVEYIGHVVEDNSVHSRLGLGAAHWFRAMEGQDMSGIDMIGGQYYFGAPSMERKGMSENDGEFYHYALGKLGASAAHLTPKKKGRALCELFGAYGWSFGVRDMKYLLDHLLSRGINHLVPHAFSMAPYPDIDCPPHFYARGNNPQFPYFVELMKYAGRMCEILNRGTHVASVAVLYDGELDWPGERMPMQKVCRVLLENQIDFDIVCLDMLRELSAYNGSVENGKLNINGVVFDALIVPQAEYLPSDLGAFAKSADSFPIYLVNQGPAEVLRDETAVEEDIRRVSRLPVIPLCELPDVLTKQGMRKVELRPASNTVSLYHYRKEGQVLMLMNESADNAYSGTLTLASQGKWVSYDALADACTPARAVYSGKSACIDVKLEPGESCLLMEKADAAGLQLEPASSKEEASDAQILDLSAKWMVARASAQEYPAFGEEQEMERLIPMSDRLPAFSGHFRYRKEFVLERVPREAWFRAESVYEVMRLTVNGRCAGFRLTPPYRLDLTGYLKEGKNELIVEVANTPARDQQNYPMPPFDFSHEALEPSGMFGKVELCFVG